MPAEPGASEVRIEVVDVFTLPDRGTVAVGVLRSGNVLAGDAVVVHHGEVTTPATCTRVEFLTYSPRRDEPRVGLVLGDLDPTLIRPGDVITTAGSRDGASSR